MAHQQPKRLNQMNDLRDMGRFPVPIYVGATTNILQTIGWTYVLHGRRNDLYVLPMWAATVIGANVLPVALLRTELNDATPYPLIEEMNFWHDQHKFASWVYAIASANMLFWIGLAWTVFSYRRTPRALAAVLLLAFVCTFFPAWIKPLRKLAG
jgi:hypothetical protein